jgi:PQQ-dependent dehydrogenase (methanol/ethanol family)
MRTLLMVPALLSVRPLPSTRALPSVLPWLSALVTVLLTAPLAAAGRAAPAGVGLQWPNYNFKLNGQRYSALDQINTNTVGQLGEICRVQVDGPTSFTAGLIVVDGTIYTTTSAETVALDATTCAMRWKSTYTPDEAEQPPSNRGVAVLDGRVFRGTADGRLIALDAATGKLLWKDVVGDPRLGESISAAPLAWQGIVYEGIAGGELGVKGRMMAYDAATGRELWRFDTIPTGTQVGANTWKDRKTAKTGGGAVWGAFSLDVTTGELFVPVGNPWPAVAAPYRPGANLFTSSLVVLDARTGALKWWHQLVPHDARDLDLANPPVLYRDSKIRDLAAFAGKDGYVQAIDRDTHKVLFHVPITTIENEGVPATAAGLHICPGFGGGAEWNGPALDVLNNTLVTGAVDWCMTVATAPVEYKAGEHELGGTIKPDPTASGWVVAVDSETGAVRWRFHAEKPVIAGITPTAGGVLFTGDTAGHFLVLDSRTGLVLKQIDTGGALAGGVVTYEIGGRQYVAFASGNVSRVTFGELGLPSVVIVALGGKNPAQDAVPRQEGVIGSPNADHGHALFTQVCSTCHGAGGNLIEGHNLATLRERRNLESTVTFIKAPVAPMPKLYPSTLSEQDVVDLAAYLQQGGWK